MNTNNSQIGHIPSEPSFENNDNESSVDQLLPAGIVITSQPLTQFTMTNMIPTQSFRIQNIVPEDNNLTQTQLARRRRERRQEQLERQQQEEQR